MTAPAAPVLTFSAATVGTVRLQWTAPTGAATYNLYRNAVLVGAATSPAVTLADPLDSFTVTAVNAGAEESDASNAIVLRGMGTAASFPQERPSGPLRTPFG